MNRRRIVGAHHHLDDDLRDLAVVKVDVPAYLYEFPTCPEGVPRAEAIEEALRAYRTRHGNYVRAYRARVPSLS